MARREGCMGKQRTAPSPSVGCSPADSCQCGPQWCCEGMQGPSGQRCCSPWQEELWEWWLELLVDHEWLCTVLAGSAGKQSWKSHGCVSLLRRERIIASMQFRRWFPLEAGDWRWLHQGENHLEWRVWWFYSL